MVCVGETCAEPLIGYACPAGNTDGERENDVALVACQLMVVDCPCVMVEGCASSAMEGCCPPPAGDFDPDPPHPVRVIKAKTRRIAAD